MPDIRVEYQEELQTLEASALGGLDLVVAALTRTLEAVEHQDIELAQIVVADDDRIDGNPFQGRMQNLAVYAYNEYRSPGVMKQSSYDRAWAAALVLIAIVMILNVIARLVYRRYKTEIR